MADDRRARGGNVIGWMIVVGSGVIAGYLIGKVMMASHAHAAIPVVAGIGLGVLSALAIRDRPLLAATTGGSVTVIAAVMTITRTQLDRGIWPITDEFTIAHYGTATQAMTRAAVVLLVLALVPGVVAAVLTAWVRRFASLNENGSA